MAHYVGMQSDSQPPPVDGEELDVVQYTWNAAGALEEKFAGKVWIWPPSSWGPPGMVNGRKTTSSAETDFEVGDVLSVTKIDTASLVVDKECRRLLTSTSRAVRSSTTGATR